jgi:hypothetical protein
MSHRFATGVAGNLMLMVMCFCRFSVSKTLWASMDSNSQPELSHDSYPWSTASNTLWASASLQTWVQFKYRSTRLQHSHSLIHTAIWYTAKYQLYLMYTSHMLLCLTFSLFTNSYYYITFGSFERQASPDATLFIRCEVQA